MNVRVPVSVALAVAWKVIGWLAVTLVLDAVNTTSSTVMATGEDVEEYEKGSPL